MRVALGLCIAMLGVADANADKCGPLVIPVPGKFEQVSRHDVKVPDIVDYGERQLDPFFEKLARVARGVPGAVVRIGTYGDSNWTNDRTAGDMRRRLQVAFGDAGHGFVAFGIPWGWYHHQNIQHGVTGKWNAWNLSAMPIRDGMYSFAGVSAESSQAGATAWVETAKSGDPVGTAASSFELSYLARPKGGSFEVLLDGEVKEVVDSEATAAEVKYLRYKVADGAHRLTIKIKKGSVRLFGVALERDRGIVLDGIGMNALNPLRMTKMDRAQLAAGLTKRNYDLLIETTGTNVWSPIDHKTVMPEFMTLLRGALPNAAFMLWSAPDFVKMNREGEPAISEPFMRFMARAKREMAQIHKIGWWDQFEALGGFGSAPKWTKDHFYEPDGIHIGPRMNAYIGERFVHALLAELARRVEKDPKLGCGSR
ncbi:MAG: hypothetical protein H0V17_25970 [Deltaproteobacteria bacterium]|nr:hypothetical protein [Deltaproteobacteria bacterium]